MGYKNIDNLIEKYWEGETSLEEESKLKAFFNTKEVPVHLKSYQPLFQYFEVEKKHSIKNSDFEASVIDQLEMPKIVPQVTKRRRLYRRVSRIAAVVLLLFGLYFAYDAAQAPPTKDRFAGFTQEEIKAYHQTKAALLYVSAKLNKGTRMATDGVMKVNEATKKINN